MFTTILTKIKTFLYHITHGEDPFQSYIDYLNDEIERIEAEHKEKNV